MCVFSCTKIVLHIQHYVKHHLLFQETTVIDCFKTYLNSMYCQIEKMFIVFLCIIKKHCIHTYCFVLCLLFTILLTF